MISEGLQWIADHVGLILFGTFVVLARIVMYVVNAWGDLDKPLESDENDISPADRVRNLRKNRKDVPIRNKSYTLATTLIFSTTLNTGSIQQHP